MTEPEDNPYAPPPPGWQRPAAPPPPYAAPTGWQAPPPPYSPPPPPYAAPPGWQPPAPPPPPYGAPPGWAPPTPYGYQQFGYVSPGSTNGFAIAALICSILLGWVPGLGGVLGITFGLIGLRRCKRTGERGRGLAIAGIVIGIAGIVLWALLIGVGLSHHPDNNNSPGLGALIY